MLVAAATADLDIFIARWTDRAGGAERANYQMFLSELCDVLGVSRPEPAGDRKFNDYVFERAVLPRDSDTTTAPKRIDLYKKNAFILEAKQSRSPDGKKVEQGQLAFLDDKSMELGKRSIARGWDAMMQNARRQAESYVYLLDADHPAPPFVIVCDVGHCLELYADFTGTGRAYGHFPDRKGYRIYLEDLRDPEIRKRLQAIWTEPHSLDPAKESARVTRDIAKRLAAVSKALEERGCNAEDVAHFLMRCLFTMFAEDVELLPPNSFTGLLEKSVSDPRHFTHRLKALWQQMERGEVFSHVVEARIRHFNGGLFSDTTVFELGREEIGELLAAAKYQWTEVDPAIFGTLLEQALDKKERKKLGAHYTPRAYVQRLVEVTVMEPLRSDWQIALRQAEAATDLGNEKAALTAIRAFHRQLCATHVLDPACGTGNFLYVSLELMKKLEGEVLEMLAQLGETESLGLDRESVDPHQFLGLELNPRAAAIAELVVWIGYLQQHYRTRTGHPAEPILRAFQNINFGKRQGYDAVLTWDGYPLPQVVEKDGRRVEAYPNPRRPEWPEADFIVGNPPFIGNKRMREFLGSDYVEAMRKSYLDVESNADFVMYWWERAAQILNAASGTLRSFGLVTTNSVTQKFNRRVVERHMHSGSAVLRMAIPDHPWIKGNASAAVRIAMTVVDRRAVEGTLFKVAHQHSLDTDNPTVLLTSQKGVIASNLALGPKTIDLVSLRSNIGLSHQGVIPVGEGFRIERRELQSLGYHTEKLPAVIKRYLIGRDLVQRSEERFIIDFFGLALWEARRQFPRLFQVVLERVKPQRDLVNRAKTRENFWIFAEPRNQMRAALDSTSRYIATCRTAKHRVFSFVSSEVLPDAKIIAITLDDPFCLSVLSSDCHFLWAARTGGFLEDRPTYQHGDCFAPFPFPDPPEALKAKLRAAGEELDAFRKQRQAEHPNLTLTQMYNVLEKLKAMAAARASSPSLSPSSPGSARGSAPSALSASQDVDGRVEPGHDGARVALTPEEERIKEQGLILVLKELHDTIDRLTAEAYGWPVDLSDDEILERLVALNAERAKEEAAGHVRWLRPDYQIPRFAKGAKAKTGDLDLKTNVVSIDKGKPSLPKNTYEHSLAVEQMLLSTGRAMDAADIARAFKGGGAKIERAVEQALATLLRYGRVSTDSSGRYGARRAA